MNDKFVYRIESDSFEFCAGFEQPYLKRAPMPIIGTEPKEIKKDNRKMKIDKPQLSLVNWDYIKHLYDEVCRLKKCEPVEFNIYSVLAIYKFHCPDKRNLIHIISQLCLETYSTNPPISAIAIDIANVRAYGNAKYGDRNNWQQYPIEIYIDAMLRHCIQAFDEHSTSKIDNESGLPHIAHIITNGQFIYEKLINKD